MRQDELDEEEYPLPKVLTSGQVLQRAIDSQRSEGKGEDSAEGCWKGSQLFVKVKLCLPYYHLTTRVAG